MKFLAMRARPEIAAHLKRTLKYLLLPLLVVAILASCNSYEKSKKDRAAIAATSKGPIAIAIVWPAAAAKIPFINGVTLAIDEINEAGGVMGRKLQATIYHEPANENMNNNVAKQVVKNEHIIAAIGQYGSASAIPASITYEENGVLFLAPASSSPDLTNHNFQYVFRTTPSDEMFGKRLAEFTYDHGYRNIIILDDNTVYGRGLANIYYAAATDLGINILSRRAYFKWQSDYRPLISELAKLHFDAVFLAGLVPEGAYVIKQFRQMGIDCPIIAGDGLDSPELCAIAGPAADGTVVPTSFDPYVDNPIVRKFVNSFEKRFHAIPDSMDAQGYDCIKLLAFTIEKIGSTEPIVLCQTLRFMKPWQGVAGNYSFKINGDLKDEKLYFKEVHNGHFEFIKE